MIIFCPWVLFTMKMLSSEERSPPFLLLVLHFMPSFRLQRRDEAKGQAVVLALFHCSIRYIVFHIPFSNCPQRVMRSLRHSLLQYVFIGRKSKTWVIMCACGSGCASGWMRVLKSRCPKLRPWIQWLTFNTGRGDLESWRHLSWHTLRVMALRDLILMWVWGGSSRNQLSSQSLKDSSFYELRSKWRLWWKQRPRLWPFCWKSSFITWPLLAYTGTITRLQTSGRLC